MKRLAILLFALPSFASAPSPSMTVEGVVSSTRGGIIALAAGTVTIDATRARIYVGGDAVALDAITPGVHVSAPVEKRSFKWGAAIPVSMVSINRFPELTLVGAISAIDRTRNTLTVLGETIRIEPSTRFGGMARTPSFESLRVDDVVKVTASLAGEVLAANGVLTIERPTSDIIDAHVKSIGKEQWVFTEWTGNTVPLRIEPSTTFTGTLKPGSPVQVQYERNGDVYTAKAIVSQVPSGPSTPDRVRQ